VHSVIQRAEGQAPARGASPEAGENASIDARLDLAAKKVALREMEAQVGGPAEAPTPPAPPQIAGGSPGIVTIARDGKIITLSNPTAEQLAAATRGETRGQNGWQDVALAGTLMWSFAAMLWIVLAHRRRSHSLKKSDTSNEMSQRMARIENAIESVAVEVERISEGQRFTTRVLSEGAAVPVAVPPREARTVAEMTSGGKNG